MQSCLFCKIISKEIPAEIVYENDEVIAFLDIHPVAPGHTMVIPKIHAENILEVPDEKIQPIFSAVKKMTAALKEAMECDGFTIGINHGKVSGQAIDHLHVHIIPRWLNDGGRSIHSVVNNPPKESLEEVKNKILKII